MGILKVFMRFYKNDTIAWWDGCVGDDVRAAVLSLNEEGLYKRACNWMYMTGEDLPGNDLVAAEILHINHNQYKAVVSSLIEKGKLIRAQGYVFNERVRTEREKYLLTSLGRERAAKKREQTRARRIEKTISAGIQALKVSAVIEAEIENTQSETIINTPPVIGNDPPSDKSSTPPVIRYDPPSHSPELPEKLNKINDELESLYQTESRAVLQQKHKSASTGAPARSRGMNRAGVGADAGAGAPAFSFSEVVEEKEKDTTHTHTDSDLVSVCVEERFAPELPDGFEVLGHGAIINCDTIRHPEFTISLAAIKSRIALRADLATVDVRKECAAFALQWAAEIEGGKSVRDVVPTGIVNFLTSSLIRQGNRDEATRYTRTTIRKRDVRF